MYVQIQRAAPDSFTLVYRVDLLRTHVPWLARSVLDAIFTGCFLSQPLDRRGRRGLGRREFVPLEESDFCSHVAACKFGVPTAFASLLLALRC